MPLAHSLRSDILFFPFLSRNFFTATIFLLSKDTSSEMRIDPRLILWGKGNSELDTAVCTVHFWKTAPCRVTLFGSAAVNQCVFIRVAKNDIMVLPQPVQPHGCPYLSLRHSSSLTLRHLIRTVPRQSDSSRIVFGSLSWGHVRLARPCRSYIPVISGGADTFLSNLWYRHRRPRK